MLTCKVGENIINTIDYSDEQTRKWSNKGILKCPVCESGMIYRNGEIKIAHFAHSKDSNCEDFYYESETEEHLEGKKIIYDWLKNQNGITNLKLEAWIPETKQRPDLYFEVNNERYVIEFQCTPIATEYIERHRLYELAGIKDIWILGMLKYNIMITDFYVSHSKRLKEIEKHHHIYLDVNTNSFVFDEFNIGYKPKYFSLNKYNKYSLNKAYFNVASKSITLNSEILARFITEDSEIAEAIRKEKEEKNRRYEELNSLVKSLNERYKSINGYHDFTFSEGQSKYYAYRITYENNYNSLVYYIKNYSIDCTEEFPTTTPFRGRRGGIGWARTTGHIKIDTLSYESFDVDSTKNFIIESISRYLRKNKYPTYCFKEGLNA